MYGLFRELYGDDERGEFSRALHELLEYGLDISDHDIEAWYERYEADRRSALPPETFDVVAVSWIAG